MSTPRYANYDNSNSGITQFSDAWVDGAKYQQLKGTGSRSNDAFNAQYAAAKGGSATKTIADDGDGTWKLIKQDKGEKSNDRKLEYKDIAAAWQAAGYDVRVQDHNPDFEGGTGEIAVRIASPDETSEAEPIDEGPIELSPEIQQAKERVKTYEDNILSGKTSRDIYGNNQGFLDEYKLNLQNPTQGFLDKYQFNPNNVSGASLNMSKEAPEYQPDNFSGSDISPYETPEPVDKATMSFLADQKKKTIKNYNFKRK